MMTSGSLIRRVRRLFVIVCPLVMESPAFLRIPFLRSTSQDAIEQKCDFQ